jgi:hypothetical protein
VKCFRAFGHTRLKARNHAASQLLTHPLAGSGGRVQTRGDDMAKPKKLMSGTEPGDGTVRVGGTTGGGGGGTQNVGRPPKPKAKKKAAPPKRGRKVSKGA